MQQNYSSFSSSGGTHAKFYFKRKLYYKKNLTDNYKSRQTSSSVRSGLNEENDLKNSHLPKSFFSSSATGAKLYFGFGLPSGLPRWLINTRHWASFLIQYSMLGRAATIRWLFVILPSFIGTLKSTLNQKQNRNCNF